MRSSCLAVHLIRAPACRRMQPSNDYHWVLDPATGHVGNLPCPRVYRAHIIIECGRSNQTLLHSYQAVLNRGGLVRVEPALVRPCQSVRPPLALSSSQ